LSIEGDAPASIDRPVKLSELKIRWIVQQRLSGDGRGRDRVNPKSFARADGADLASLQEWRPDANRRSPSEA